MTRTASHPSWCADYRCTSSAGLGEHRSEPVTLARAGARVALVVSLVQRVDRPYPYAEIRISVRLRTRTPEGQVAEVTALLRRLSRLLHTGGSR